MIRGGGARARARTLINGFTRGTHNTASNAAAAAAAAAYSPFESKIQKILGTEIQYQSDYAPPHQPVTEYDTFVVEDRPTEQWVQLRRTQDDEEIQIEATMFDGFILDTRQNMQLHINMTVDLRKQPAGNNDTMKFVCSAWPNSLEIHKVFISNSSSRHDASAARLYMGPHFNHLNAKLRDGFYEFLDTRGIHGGLSMFLHRCMMNKDRIELIHWLRKVDCFLKD